MTRPSLTLSLRNCVLLLASLACAGTATAIHAQNSGEKAGEPEQTRTFVLKNVTQINDLNDQQTALRNVLPRAHIYALASQNAIVVKASAADLAEAQQVLSETDKPRKAFRLTYTIKETDNRQAQPRHYSLVVLNDGKTTLKQGSRVPIATGSLPQESSTPPATQFQYVDIGLNIESFISGVSLRTKIEESSVSADKSTVGIQDPIIEQTTLESNSIYTPGKSLVLGSIDVPGTNRHEEISVVAEQLP